MRTPHDNISRLHIYIYYTIYIHIYVYTVTECCKYTHCRIRESERELSRQSSNKLCVVCFGNTGKYVEVYNYYVADIRCVPYCKSLPIGVCCSSAEK